MTIESDIIVMEHAGRTWRFTLKNESGEVLPPDGFVIYGAAECPGHVRRIFPVAMMDGVATVQMPGLPVCDWPWKYQIFAQEVGSGVEWLLCSGAVNVVPRVACGSAALSPELDEYAVVLDSTTPEITVELGDSAVSVAENARRAAQAAQDSLAAKDDAVLAKGDAEKAKDGAVLAKGDAEKAKDEAVLAKGDAEKAKDEAEVSAKAAGVAQRGAEAAQGVAEDASAQAGRYAEQAVGASDGAVVAQGKAEAAQGVAEAKAAEAVAAAEAVLQPESVAVQAARPAVMLLVREELLRILGDSSLYDVDTDGQKIIVHTDRLSDEQLAEVEDMLERFVPGFIEVGQYNHNLEVSWRDINKYAECSTAQEMYMVDTEKNFFDEKLGYQIMDVCADGSFPYANQLTSTAAGGSNYGTNVFSSAMTERGRFIGSFPDLIHWYGGGSVEELILDAPELKSFAEVYSNRITRIKCNSQILTSVVHLFWSSALRSVECVFPKLSTARFTTNAQLDKESVLRIISSLPSYTSGPHELQLGIHTDLQNDEEVLAALALVDVEQTPVEEGGKGWTLAVKWNGTPTAQTSTTYGFRKPTIYARDCEFGGKRYLLTAHYVSDPENYEEFSSVEAAAEYFGIQLETENN